jgi:hypothetical protein
MIELEHVIQEPFLLRFKESEEVVARKSPIDSPEKGGESNPIEEEKSPEPSKPSPWGD